MTTRKVLMLHGFTQNSIMFSKRIAAIRKACDSNVDFVFVDAPHVLEPVDIFVDNTAALDAAEAISSGSGSSHATYPDKIPRAWWRANAERTRYDGAWESLAMLRDVLAKDRFDGVFGFSQGAAMAALLTAILEKPQVYPPFLIDGQPPHPPFEFCVCVSGFLPTDANLSLFFSPPTRTPTLHLYGTNDVIVVPTRSHALIRASSNAPGAMRVLVHDRGHFVPATADWRAFFRAFFHNPVPLHSVPAPSGVLDTNAEVANAPEGARLQISR